MAPALKKVTAGKCLRIEMRVFVGSVPSPDAQTAGVFLVVDLHELDVIFVCDVIHCL